MNIWLILPLVLLAAAPLRAGSTIGGTLLESPSARASAMADAVGADRGDIASFAFNPAALTSMDSSQACLLYHRGLADDHYASAMVGHDFKTGAFGISAGSYDGGSVTLSDGMSERTVSAQKDLIAAVGFAAPLGQTPFSFGATGKYFSSEIAESAKASAVAFDVGARADRGENLSFGGSIQNIGKKVSYVRTEHPLPRLVRLSAAYDLGDYKRGGTIVADIAHVMDDHETVPSLGGEFSTGPLAIRAGYRFSHRVDAFSAGAGITVGRASLDYAFGLASELDNTHRLSLTFIFGD